MAFYLWLKQIFRFFVPVLVYVVILSGASWVYTQSGLVDIAQTTLAEEKSAFGLETGEAVKTAALNPNGITFGNPGEWSKEAAKGIATIINSVINALLIMSGVLALFMLVWYGIRAIFYAGTPDKAKEIGTVFVWVMVGIAVLLLAKPILNTVFGGISDADGTVTSSNFLKPFDPDVDDKTKLITKVAEPLAGTVGNIIDFLMMISAVIAVVMIVWYGIRTIFYAASPEEAAKIKTVILWVVLGLIILLIAKPLVGILWWVSDTSKVENFVANPGTADDILKEDSAVATNIKSKLFDWIKFFEQIIAAFAVVIIIISGARMVMSAGNDNARTNAVETIQYVVIGLLVMVFANTIVAAFYNKGGDVGGTNYGANADSVVDEIVGMTNFALQILAVLSVVMAIYGGYKYLVGDSEWGKKTILNALIGMIVIIASYSIVAFVLPS